MTQEGRLLLSTPSTQVEMEWVGAANKKTRLETASCKLDAHPHTKQVKFSDIADGVGMKLVGSHFISSTTEV